MCNLAMRKWLGRSACASSALVAEQISRPGSSYSGPYGQTIGRSNGCRYRESTASLKVSAGLQCPSARRDVGRPLIAMWRHTPPSRAAVDDFPQASPTVGDCATIFGAGMFNAPLLIFANMDDWAGLGVHLHRQPTVATYIEARHPNIKSMVVGEFAELTKFHSRDFLFRFPEGR